MSAVRSWLTPAAPAAIAVVRVRAAAALLAQLVERPLPAPGRAGVGHLRGPDARLVDQAVLVRTGPDELELMVHGGPGMRAAVDACLEAHGVLAAPMPMPESDAAGAGEWQRLAAAASPAAVAWLLAHPGQLPPFPHAYLSRAPVVLITGPANAGKSTLLNAWCGWSRALVSAEPGTTRDLVMAETLVGGWRLRLVDSAGLRDTADPIERAGQELVDQARGWADAVVCLEPSPGAAAAQPGDLLVQAKADLGGDAMGPLRWSVHGLPGRSAGELLAALGDAVLARLGLPRDGGS
jgi:tRNA U34 5-carboxymethylaminomethyl modifying GTPase MnmE/TrmE